MTATGMWVVKLGGSLQHDPSLPRWLETLANAGRGRVCVVPGGGAFADQVREAQAATGFSDVVAHNMAVLAMAQMGLMLCGLNRALQPARSESEIAAVAHEGSTPVWLPLDLLREGPDELTTWDVTSDSLALWLANRLNAERLVVVKSCAIDPELSLAQLSEQGVLDRRFATMAASATMPIQVLEHTALAEVSVHLSSASR
jgi:aspartokinase-like uncharacterized kinase